MRTIFLILFSLSFAPLVEAKGMEDLARETARKVDLALERKSCEDNAQLAVDRATKAADENSSAISSKYAGALSLTTTAGLDALDGLDLYYVTTSDESGACIWASVVSVQENCESVSVKEIICL